MDHNFLWHKKIKEFMKEQWGIWVRWEKNTPRILTTSVQCPLHQLWGPWETRCPITNFTELASRSKRKRCHKRRVNTNSTFASTGIPAPSIKILFFYHKNNPDMGQMIQTYVFYEFHYLNEWMSKPWTHLKKAQHTFNKILSFFSSKVDFPQWKLH